MLFVVMWGEAWASLVRRGLESAVIPNINIMIKDISIITDTEWSVWLENEMLLSSWVFRHLLMPLIWNSNLGKCKLKVHEHYFRCKFSAKKWVEGFEEHLSFSFPSTEPENYIKRVLMKTLLKHLKIPTSHYHTSVGFRLRWVLGWGQTFMGLRD